MKRIIFVIESMNIGGTEKALLSMISEIPKDKYDMTILMLENRGGFLGNIPNHIKVKCLDEYKVIEPVVRKSAKELVVQEITERKYMQAIRTLFYYGISRISGDYNVYFNNKIMNRIESLVDEYDIAVSYQGPPSHFSAYLVSKKIKAKKKIQWIHSDVSKLNLDIKTTNKLYKSFDKIFIVSTEGKNKFDEMFPQLKNKTEVFINILSENLINKQAEKKKGFSDNFDGIKILTVGRLSGEKGQALTIPILARLKKEGYNVRWYCVGDGVLKEYYEKIIADNNVQEDYLLLGNDSNPYPYFKECDIYVQPSKFEGYCITLAEARVFNKPIVATNFVGAREQLVNNETGFIVEYNEDEVFTAIKELINNKEIKNKFINNLKNELVDTTKEMNKFYNIVDCI